MSGVITNDIKVIVFQLAEEDFGIPVEQVRSIEKVQYITRVPKTVGFVKGVINLRGLVTPIIDLRKRFGLEEQVHTDSTRIIIVTLDNLEVGLIVDAANDVLDISSESIEPPPKVVGVVEAEYLSGVVKVGKRLLILLKLESVLDLKELEIRGN